MIIPGIVCYILWGLICRHEGNPQSLATLTSEIRRLSVTGTFTPGTSSAAGSYVHESCSRTSTGHDSGQSFPPCPPLPSSFRSDQSSSPTSEPDTYPISQRYPTPPPQSQYPAQSPQSMYSSIRPPPAVARLAGKEKKKNVSSPVSPPTSHPSSQPTTSQGISGIMNWGKKDTKVESKWESGVIGRERARVIIDGSNKR